jgi:hypothetical protein
MSAATATATVAATTTAPTANSSPLRSLSNNSQGDEKEKKKMAKTRTTEEEGHKDEEDRGRLTMQLSSSVMERLQRGPRGVPSKEIVSRLFNEALLVADGEQWSLEGSGLLSFNQVLIPSVAVQHDVFLMELQQEAAQMAENKIKGEQRQMKRRLANKKRKKGKQDDPEANDDAKAPQHPELQQQQLQEARERAQKPWIAARTALYDAAAAAVEAAERNRLERIRSFQQSLVQEEAERTRIEQERIDMARREKEAKDRMRLITRPQRLRAARKRYPANKEVSREQLHLLSELDKMEREEEMWKKAQKALDEQQRQQQQAAAVVLRSASASEPPNDPEASASSPVTEHVIGNVAADPEVLGSASAAGEIVVAPAAATDFASVDAPLMGAGSAGDASSAAQQVEYLRAELDRMHLSCHRIEQALGVVQDLVKESEKTRDRLYEHYMCSQRGGSGSTRRKHNNRAAVQALSQQSSSTTGTTTSRMAQSAAAVPSSSSEAPVPYQQP